MAWRDWPIGLCPSFVCQEPAGRGGVLRRFTSGAFFDQSGGKAQQRVGCENLPAFCGTLLIVAVCTDSEMMRALHTSCLPGSGGISMVSPREFLQGLLQCNAGLCFDETLPSAQYDQEALPANHAQEYMHCISTVSWSASSHGTNEPLFRSSPL